MTERPVIEDRTLRNCSRVFADRDDAGQQRRLDLLAASKRLPHDSEAGFGGIALDGSQWLNRVLIKRTGLSADEIDDSRRQAIAKMHPCLPPPGACRRCTVTGLADTTALKRPGRQCRTIREHNAAGNPLTQLPNKANSHMRDDGKNRPLLQQKISPYVKICGKDQCIKKSGIPAPIFKKCFFT